MASKKQIATWLSDLESLTFSWEQLVEITDRAAKEEAERILRIIDERYIHSYEHPKVQEELDKLTELIKPRRFHG